MYQKQHPTTQRTKGLYAMAVSLACRFRHLTTQSSADCLRHPLTSNVVLQVGEAQPIGASRAMARRVGVWCSQHNVSRQNLDPLGKTNRSKRSRRSLDAARLPIDQGHRPVAAAGYLRHPDVGATQFRAPECRTYGGLRLVAITGHTWVMVHGDLQYNMAVDTDAQRRPLPAVAPVGRRSLLR